jgi:hypothetical protein
LTSSSSFNGARVALWELVAISKTLAAAMEVCG